MAMSTGPDRPENTAPPGRDFLSWGKQLLRRHLEQRDEPTLRKTSPLMREPVARRPAGTSLLNQDGTWLENPRHVTLSELARIPVVLRDMRDQPLVEPLAAGSPDLSPEDEQRILERMTQLVREVGAAFASTPDLRPRGRYAGLSLADALDRTTVRDILDFLAYLKSQGRTFAERPVRFTETYVSWLVDHGSA